MRDLRRVRYRLEEEYLARNAAKSRKRGGMTELAEALGAEGFWLPEVPLIAMDDVLNEEPGKYGLRRVAQERIVCSVDEDGVVHTPLEALGECLVFYRPWTEIPDLPTGGRVSGKVRLAVAVPGAGAWDGAGPVDWDDRAGVIAVYRSR